MSKKKGGFITEFRKSITSASPFLRVSKLAKKHGRLTATFYVFDGLVYANNHGFNLSKVNGGTDIIDLANATSQYKRGEGELVVWTAIVALYGKPDGIYILPINQNCLDATYSDFIYYELFPDLKSIFEEKVKSIEHIELQRFVQCANFCSDEWGKPKYYGIAFKNEEFKFFVGICYWSSERMNCIRLSDFTRCVFLIENVVPRFSMSVEKGFLDMAINEYEEYIKDSVKHFDGKKDIEDYR